MSRATRMTAKAGDKKMAAGANYTVKGAVSYFARGFSPEVLERLVKAPQVQEAMKPNEIPSFRTYVCMATGIMVTEDIIIREGRLSIPRDSRLRKHFRSCRGQRRDNKRQTVDSRDS